MPEKKAIYRPESGLEDVSVLNTVSGDRVGAFGYGKHCTYHAVKLQSGREILIQEVPAIFASSLSPEGTDEFFFNKMNHARKEGKVQDERLVLVLEGSIISSGVIEDASDFDEETRRGARCTLDKVMGAKV